MTATTKHPRTPRRHLALCGLAWATLTLLGACAALSPTKTPPPAFYALDGAQSTQIEPPNDKGLTTGPTLIINPTRAAAGFDSQRIMYLREPHKLAYFAQSEWVDPPALMLGPLLVKSIETTGKFRAVALAAGSATGELRLDTEIIRLQHDFQTQPSHVRFTLRAYLVDDKTRSVVTWREFDTRVTSASEDPYGGVQAANEAVQQVLQKLSQFLTEGQK